MSRPRNSKSKANPSRCTRRRRRRTPDPTAETGLNGTSHGARRRRHRRVLRAERRGGGRDDGLERREEGRLRAYGVGGRGGQGVDVGDKGGESVGGLLRVGWRGGGEEGEGGEEEGGGRGEGAGEVHGLRLGGWVELDGRREGLLAGWLAGWLDLKGWWWAVCSCVVVDVGAVCSRRMAIQEGGRV